MCEFDQIFACMEEIVQAREYRLQPNEDPLDVMIWEMDQVTELHRLLGEINGNL